ncbi:MAG TPA: hypothetical protein VGL68_10260 [Solirubrobacteraceae bacterium]
MVLTATNLGDAPAGGTISLTDTVPAGLEVTGVTFVAFSKKVGKKNLSAGDCSVTGQQVTCASTPPPAGYEAFIEKTLTEAPWKELIESEPSQREFYKGVVEEFVHPKAEFEAEFSVAQVEPYEDLEVRVAVMDTGAIPGALNRFEVSGGSAAAALARPVPIGPAPAFGAEEFQMVPEEEGGGLDVHAGSHPYQVTTTFALNQNAEEALPGLIRGLAHPPAAPRNLHFKLPAGLIGNATLVSQCTDPEFTHVVNGGFENECPSDTVLGVATVTVFEPLNIELSTLPVPLFNLVPEKGEPARLGFIVAGDPVTIDTAVRTGADYGITATVSNTTELVNFASSSVTIWGVPGDSSHDGARGWTCLASRHWTETGGRELPCVNPPQSNPAPFWTMPSSCKAPFVASVEGDSWPTSNPPASPAHPKSLSLERRAYSLTDGFGRELGLSGCNQLSFAPFVETAPDVSAASTPTGLATTVKVPQEVSHGAKGLASSSVRDIEVKFPEGVTVNPASADGLEACSEEQVGFTGFTELDPSGEPGASTPQFTPQLPNPFEPGTNFCPDASKIGTVLIKVPVIAHPLEGSLYLATQDVNPFNSLVAAYIVAEDKESGVLVKLPGEVSLDPVTGRLTATFNDSPDAPLESAEIHLFGGDRAPLSTPTHCGTYTTEATFTPWSGTAPVTSKSQFKITTGPNGTTCPPPALPFAPSLTAGSPNVSAGSFSPLVTTIGREDGQQNISKVQLHFAPGMSGILSGVPLCDEADANAGTCPQASLIGKTIVSVGLGGDPFTVVGGQVFLTEKIAGSPGDAPFGLSIVNPAKAGPFDLGKVIVRATIEVDPHTAALTVTTGEIPHILDGIPLQIKHVNVTIDRNGFTFNPTNCNQQTISGSVGAFEGGSSPVSVPFQVTNCAALKFTPKFDISTSGKTSKAQGASLIAKLSEPNEPQGSQANIALVKVELPKQLPSRLTTLQKACTNKQFELNPAACPPESKIGFAKVTTPLLPVPLEGPAIFVSHGGEAFPSLTMVLQGYGVSVDLVGTTFISKGGITSTTFKTVPDVPFNTFTLTLPQGKFSALAANGDLCTSSLTMPSEFLGQNGAKLNQNTPVSVTGCAKKKALTRAQKLAAALKLCKKKAKAKRASCNATARKRYGPVKAKRKTKGKGKA